MYFNLYLDKDRHWRWTLFAANHRKVADSGEGYFNERDCLNGISLVVGTNAYTPIYKQ